MDNDELIRKLMKTFLVELEEHIQALENDLLLLEHNDNAARVQEIAKTLFRTAHSMKGAARAVNIGVVESAAHSLESIFAAVRDNRNVLTPEVFQVLFEAVDAFKDAARHLQADESLEDSSLVALLPALQIAAADKSTPAVVTDVSHAGTATPLHKEKGFVRISSGKLDHMIALGGELLVARRRVKAQQTELGEILDVAGRAETTKQTAQDNLQWLTHQINEVAASLVSDRRALDQVADSLEVEVMHARMVPFAEACEGFQRTVRDLAREAGKKVNLVIEDGEIEIDRSIAETLKDPLLHLLRNAVDHGIELSADRTAAGKSASGRITVSASLTGGRVEIIVADDGRGFDRETFLEQARKRELPVPDTDEDILSLIFTAGFSTSTMVTAISGRGVGLDVVKSAVESAHGNIDAVSERGGGTCFTLSMPLSLTRLHALLITAGGQTWVFDNAAVQDLVRVDPDELGTIEGRQVLKSDESPIPVFVLTEILGQPVHEALYADGKIPVIVLSAGTSRAAFMVDELVSVQEVVIKDLGPRLRDAPSVSGATVLADGRIALILNATELVHTALGKAPARLSAAARAGQVAARKRLLVVEDTATTRILMKNILETAGFDVTTAVDGIEAWQALQESSFDLVVSDIEMPHMDGFALTEAIRASKRLQYLPVILVTGMESEQDRMQGMEAGADAYVVKSAFDQTELTQTIGQIL